jgi:hypothetical protein
MPREHWTGVPCYGAVTAVRFAAMLEKDVLMPLPRSGTAAIRATAMRAAIRLYSMAVAPDSFRTNRLRKFFMSAGPWLCESLSGREQLSGAMVTAALTNGRPGRLMRSWVRNRRARSRRIESGQSLLSAVRVTLLPRWEMPIALIVGAWSRWTAVGLMIFTVVMTWATYRSAMFGLPFRNPQHPQFFKKGRSSRGCYSTS